MNLLTRIKNMVNICRLAVAQSGRWKVTLQDGQTLSEIPHAQNFGFKGAPPVNSRAVLLSRAGEQGAGMLIIVDNDDDAPALVEGEAVFYNAHGASIVLLANGDALYDGGNLLVKDGDIDIEDGVLEIKGVQVVKEQQPLITPPAGGSIVDAQARAAINTLITTLQTHGLTL